MACCELSSSLLDLSQSKRGMKLGWVIRCSSRGLADILDVGIHSLSCKKSSSKSKCASAGAARVACSELSSLLLDLSQSKRGMKLGWVLRCSSRGLADILDVGIHWLSCKESSTESKCASAGDARVTCCELSQSLLDLSQTKRGIKLRWVLRHSSRGLADILVVGICFMNCKKSSTKSKCASAGAARVACCELSSSLLDLSQSKRGMKLGWVLRCSSRGLADILDVGIHWLSCKKSSTNSKCAFACDARVACCELSSSLLDLSQSKRGMKLGWVLRCSSRGLADILDVGIHWLSCKKSSTKSKCAFAGDARVACCEVSSSLLDLSQSKTGMKLGWVLRCSSRGLADISDVGICCLSCRKSSTKSKCTSAGAARVTCCELSQSLFDLSQTKRGMKLGWVFRSRGRDLAEILDVGICCLSCKKSSTKSKCASAGAARVACCELSSSLLDLSQLKRGMKLGWVLRCSSRGLAVILDVWHLLRELQEISKKIQMCICWSCQGGLL